MKNGLRILAILALIAASGLATEAVLANCQGEGPYEVRQCSKSTWFATPPGPIGPVATSWWAIGYGTKTGVSSATNVSPEGSGFINNAPLSAGNGVFTGIDNGTLDTTGLDLVDATTIAGIGAPAGSLCFSSRSNWGSPGIDSCIDVNRTSADGSGTATNVSDQYVNKYWDASPGKYYYGGYYYYYMNHQLDPPMGVLLTEGTGTYFAAAFFATAAKAIPRDQNLDPGQYWMSEIVNGDTGPTGPNVVPWQPVPTGDISASLSDPQDPASPRNLAFDWTATSPRFIHDNSTRPCYNPAAPLPSTPCPSVSVGVGVLDQGPLIHFEVEMVAMDLSSVCGTAWTTVANTKVDYPATSVTALGVPAQSCVRLKTTFGKTPSQSLVISPISATNRLNNFKKAQKGQLGDEGYSIVSAATKVGGPLVSSHASLTAISKERNNLRVKFATDTELNVNSFDVVGLDGRGGSKVLGTVACRQCTTGLGASYDELISGVKLQGAKQIQVVIQPSGVKSNTLDLK